MIWPGIVVDDKDPLKKGRLKIRTAIFGTEVEIADNDLPWAEACTPFSGKNSGMIAVPSVGAGVWVVYQNNNPVYPVWLGGYFPEKNIISEHRYKKSPISYVIKTPVSQKIVIDEEKGILISDTEAQNVNISKNENSITVNAINLNENVSIDKKTEVKGSFIAKARNISLSAISGLFSLVSATIIALSAVASISLTTAIISITASTSITLMSTLIILGEKTKAQSLCNETFLLLYNKHTHSYIPGDNASTQSDTPFIEAEIGVHTTTNVRGS